MLIGNAGGFMGTESVFEKLQISSAFTTVLSSAEAPSEGQISCINPECLLMLHGVTGPEIQKHNRVGFFDADGVLQDTLIYSASLVGDVLKLRYTVSDNEYTYFLATRQQINNDEIYLWATSHDGTVVQWVRRLNYLGAIQDVGLGLAVTEEYIYFTLSQLDLIFGQLDKTDGTLNWTKETSYTGFVTGLEADENGLYACVTNRRVIVHIDDTGLKVWEKDLSNAYGAENVDGNINGFCKAGASLFVSGKDVTDSTTLTILKLNAVDGTLLGQVNISGNRTPDGLDTTRLPSNLMAAGGGRVVVGYTTTAGDSEFDIAIMDENLAVETDMYRLYAGSSKDTVGVDLSLDNVGNVLVYGFRADGSNTDHFLSAVRVGETLPAGWAVTARTVSTPSYTLSDGSLVLSDLTPEFNASHTMTVSSPTDLTTEAW